MIHERFFNKCLALLKQTDEKKVKIGVLNYLLNLAWKDNQSDTDSMTRKYMLDLHLKDMLITMKENEREQEVKV